MKTVITDIGMHKTTINASGEIEIVLLGNGKKFSGRLTPEEIEQLNFRITEVSEGAISFDPPPQDLIVRHSSDLITLEEQANELQNLRDRNSTLATQMVTLTEEYAQYRKDHEEADTVMASLRSEIMTLKGQLFETQGDLERLKAPKSVHNERSHSPEAKTREVTSVES